MSKLKLWVGISLVFILGSLAGSLGMGMYIQNRFERAFFDDSRPGHPPHPPMMRLLMRRLDKELDLTETQRHTIEKLMTQLSENIHSIMREKHPEVEKLAKGNLELIKEKLTLEQRKKLENLKLFERMKSRMHPKPHPGPGLEDHPPDNMFASLKERLELSEEHEERVRLIIEDGIEKRHKILEVYRETARRDRNAMRNEINEIQETVEKQLEEILSAEQMSAYKEHQQERQFMRKDMRPRRPYEFGGPPLE